MNNFPFYSYITNEYHTRGFYFRCHRSRDAAGKQKVPKYKGSAINDYDLTILDRKDFLSLIEEIVGEGGYIDWDEKYIGYDKNQ